MATKGESIPAASELVTRARTRLAEELQRWPPVDSPLLWAQMRHYPGQIGQALPSLGAQVHYIRAAHQRSELRLTHDLFVLLLERIERVCARWAAQSAVQTPGIPMSERELIREELRQELTLQLWEQVVLRRSSAWELFFQRSLTFAQQHTATTFMQQRGYWLPVGVERPQRAVHWLMTRLAEESESADEQPAPASSLADEASEFSGAELADLRALMLQLPAHERTAIVLRYWQDVVST